jgi:hypothetical protein
MRPLKLDRILAAEPTLQPVLTKAHELRDLAGLLDRYLPPDLARQARVVNFRDGEIVLVAASSAAAAKLRLLAPSLTILFAKQRLQVNSVSIRVQPKGTREGAAAARKTVHFSTLALERMGKLYKTMSASPARDALGVLLRRHGVAAEVSAPEPRLQRAPGPPASRKPKT